MERGQFLVETSWLAEHLEDQHLRIVDMRGYVRTVEHDGVQDALYVGNMRKDTFLAHSISIGAATLLILTML